VAVSCDNQFLMTGDASGIVKTWALAGMLAALERGCQDGDIAPGAVQAAAAWRAHAGAVSSIASIRSAPDLLLTSGRDCTVAIWSVHGAHVGTFGQVRLVRAPCCCQLTSGLLRCRRAVPCWRWCEERQGRRTRMRAR
jgi:WD40 repeat protein